MIVYMYLHHLAPSLLQGIPTVAATLLPLFIVGARCTNRWAANVHRRQNEATLCGREAIRAAHVRINTCGFAVFAGVSYGQDATIQLPQGQFVVSQEHVHIRCLHHAALRQDTGNSLGP